MDNLEDYLNRIMEAADLAPRDARRVRAELNEHLQEIIELGRRNGVPDEEVMAMVEQDFGKPDELGKAIARAKGRFRTYLKKRARYLPRNFIAIAISLLVLNLVVYRLVFEPYRVASDALSPLVQKGNRVCVNKLAGKFRENDVVLWRENGRARLGIVKDADIEGHKVVVSRHGEEDRTLDTTAIIGRVFLQTR